MPLDPDEVRRNVGLRVAELREGLGLTQQAMAEKAGFSLKYLQRIEAGSENLTLSSLVRLANLLEVDVDQLLSEAQREPRARGRPRRGDGKDGS